jgi:hypothetical protein
MSEHYPSTAMKQAEFIGLYKLLCMEYGMYIGVGCNECGTEIWQDVEEASSQDDLNEHFAELIENS